MPDVQVENMYFRTCEHCGAHLDPGESCDCVRRSKRKSSSYMALFESDHDGQMKMKVEERNENNKY